MVPGAFFGPRCSSVNERSCSANWCDRVRCSPNSALGWVWATVILLMKNWADWWYPDFWSGLPITCWYYQFTSWYYVIILLMEESLLTSWYGESTIIYAVLYMSTGAGFLPSICYTWLQCYKFKNKQIVRCYYDEDLISTSIEPYVLFLRQQQYNQLSITIRKKQIVFTISNLWK